MKSFKVLVLCSISLMAAACANTPMGPTVRALPAPGKPFDQFQADQAVCKQYADEQVRDQAERANTTGLLEGLGGTALGAGLGAAIGGGRGAAIGAAGGAVAGTAVGAHTSGREQHGIQQQYNDAYVGCMVSKGNHVDHPVVMQQPAPQTTVIYQQAAPPPTVVYTAPPPPAVVYVPQPVPQPPPGY